MNWQEYVCYEDESETFYGLRVEPPIKPMGKSPLEDVLALARRLNVVALRQYEISVVGVKFDNRQEDLAFLYGQQEVGVQLAGRLRREPENKFDTNAIAVELGAKDSRFYWSPVGYVPKNLAAKLATKMDAGTEIRVINVKVIEGGDTPTYGVRITVQYENDEEEAASV